MPKLLVIRPSARLAAAALTAAALSLTALTPASATSPAADVLLAFDSLEPVYTRSVSPTVHVYDPDHTGELRKISIDGAFAGTIFAGLQDNYFPAPTLTEGPHDVTITRSTDAGLTYGTPEHRELVVDTTSPGVTLSAPESGPVTGFASWTSTEPVTISYTVDGGPAVPVEGTSTSGTIPLLLTLGQHTIVVSATDAAGNVTISGPATTKVVGPFARWVTRPVDSQDRSATFAWDAVEGVTWHAQLDGYDVTVDGTSFTATNLGVGGHWFAVTGTDAAGNTGGTVGITWNIRPDTTAPVLNLTGHPSTTTSETAATFTWDSTEDATYTVNVDGHGAITTNHTWTATNLSTGQHTFTVTGTDASNNTGGPMTFTWTVRAPADTTAPQLTLTGHPTTTTTATSATFTWTSTETATYTVTIDGHDHTTSARTYTTGELGAGAHTLRLTGTDAAHNSGTPVMFAWTVKVPADTTAPRLSVTHTAENRDATREKVTWTTDEVATVYGSLDGARASVLPGRSSVASVAYGKHTLAVYAVDKAGNRSVTRTISWTAADRTAPTLHARATVDSYAKTITVAVSSSERLTSLTATVDGRPAVVSKGAVRATHVHLGRHTVRIYTRDAAGNRSSATVTATMTAVVSLGDISAAHLAAGVRHGSAKADVTRVQRGLHLVGSARPGVFDKVTVAAVRRWQQLHHIYVTGRVDARTWRSIVDVAHEGDGVFRVTASAVPVSRLRAGITVGAKGQDVVDIQRLLHIAETGTFDKATVTAVKAFQRRHHLVVDGIVGVKTWPALVG